MKDAADPGPEIIDERIYITRIMGGSILVGVAVALCASFILFGPAPVTLLLLVASVVFVRLGVYVYSIPYFSISPHGMKFPNEIQGLSGLSFGDIIRARLARTGPEDDAGEFMVLFLRDGSKLKIRPDRELERKDFSLLRDYMDLDYEKRRISFVSSPRWDGIVN